MSNTSHNRKEIERYRKELKSIMTDISMIDKDCLNYAVNEGVKFAKRRTNVGKGGNLVDFYTHDGKHVTFSSSINHVGGLMRKSWKSSPTIKPMSGGARKIISNQVVYASFVNDGHVIRNRRGGPIKGFVPGQHILEKTEKYVDKMLIRRFKERLAEVKARHDC